MHRSRLKLAINRSPARSVEDEKEEDERRKMRFYSPRSRTTLLYSVMRWARFCRPRLLDETHHEYVCNSVTRYLTLTTSQFTPMHLHDSFLGLAFSSPCLRVTSSQLFAHFSSIYSCELKKKVYYSQQLSADLLQRLPPARFRT